MHKNYAEHSAQIARGKLRGRCPWRPVAQPWHNKVERKSTLERLFCTGCSIWMKEEQYGTVSSRNARGLWETWVHEIETVGLQSFCGKPAKITIPFALILRIPTTTAISPRQKKMLCARCPGTAGGSRFGTHQRGAIMSKKQRNFKEKQ